MATVPYVEPEPEEPIVIVIDDLEKIELIEVEYIVADLKGNMSIKFKEFIYADETTATEESNDDERRRRSLIWEEDEKEVAAGLTLRMEL